MKLFDYFLRKRHQKTPEDDFLVTITDLFVFVEHPKRKSERVLWENIVEIKLINTDQGPWLPDVWLSINCVETMCLIPQGAKGYDEIFDRLSQYDDFDFENATKSMSSTENSEYVLWKRKQ